MKKNTKITLIPFDGFYESHAMAAIESQIEQDLEYYPDLDPNDAKIDFEKFAKMVPDIYARWLNDEHDIKLTSLEFDALDSPRFYNFGTDLIFCHISKRDIWKLYTLFVSDMDEAQERINARFKSRSGFASFYDQFLTDWKTKPLSKWDQNELSVLFPEPDYSNFYDDCNCNGEISDCIEYPESKLQRTEETDLAKKEAHDSLMSTLSVWGRDYNDRQRRGKIAALNIIIRDIKAKDELSREDQAILDSLPLFKRALKRRGQIEYLKMIEH